jgi:hypothetical protein
MNTAIMIIIVSWVSAGSFGDSEGVAITTQEYSTMERCAGAIKEIQDQTQGWEREYGYHRKLRAFCTSK